MEDKTIRGLICKSCHHVFELMFEDERPPVFLARCAHCGFNLEYERSDIGDWSVRPET